MHLLTLSPFGPGGPWKDKREENIDENKNIVGGMYQGLWRESYKGHWVSAVEEVYWGIFSFTLFFCDTEHGNHNIYVCLSVCIYTHIEHIAISIPSDEWIHTNWTCQSSQ